VGLPAKGERLGRDSKRVHELNVMKTEDLERRAIWALQDICEVALKENGVYSCPKADWDQLVKDAREHVKHMPVEFDET
jgi:hypothetical protein